MKPRAIREGVSKLGAVDWNRRLFDSLIPLPGGTSYNAYLVQGSDKTALLDTVDPAWEGTLLRQLAGVERIDYVVSHHCEQDHSGTIPRVLELYPQAKVLCSLKAKPLLLEHLRLSPERIQVVEDDEALPLGGKTLRFVYTPWAHWPETMSSYLVEDRILFSCDLFGSHLATSNLYASAEPHVLAGAKRYYAEIMMPFRKVIARNMDKIRPLDPALIAPSHGPIYDRPGDILAAYGGWVSDSVANQVVIPYITMHGSTQAMVDYLAAALVELGVEVKPFELSATDLGELAMALVDPATVVIATPTVLGGPHPTVFAVTQLANLLRPKVRYAAVIGSYGWGTKAVEQITALIPNLAVEILPTVLCKGMPGPDTYAELDALAEAIRARHAAL